MSETKPSIHDAQFPPLYERAREALKELDRETKRERRRHWADPAEERAYWEAVSAACDRLWRSAMCIKGRAVGRFAEEERALVTADGEAALQWLQEQIGVRP